ncbi:hypothetical protein [Stenotrophomonas sp. CFBP 13718]|uniref:hypothetical protein n=1 Tax=Stenotrophomonas sp. CFBP 13718 TaxID=2775304 RepID=UPI001784B2AF|nr:hypothetical protein [Stenotrophomonas sp. CFBP 13718]MBD8696989.1 hypothetical protein [Stenotrophomonas sp. CFBP 13718]
MRLSNCSLPPPSFSLAERSTDAAIGAAKALRRIGDAVITVLNQVAPNRVLHGLKHVVTGALLLSRIYNAAASPLRHGGRYQTEANYLFDLDVPELRACLGRTGAGQLPAERRVAQCQMESTLRTCAGGADLGCVDVAERTLERGRQQAVKRAADNLQADIESRSNELVRDEQLTAPHALQKAEEETRQRFQDSDEYGTSMSALYTALSKQTRRDLTDTAVRYSADEVQLLIGDPLQGRRFWKAAIAPAVQLGRALAEAGGRVFIQRPELVDKQWHADFLQDVAVRYPQAGQAKLTREQATQVLQELAFWLNDRDPGHPGS